MLIPPQRRKKWLRAERNSLSSIYDLGSKTARGRFFVGTCRDAPSGPGTARPNEVPANACGRFADRFRRRCFDPAPSTPGGAHAPIEGRSRRTLGGGAYPWGKRTRNVEPY